MPYVFAAQSEQIDIRQARKTTEHECIADNPHAFAADILRPVDESDEFLLRQIGAMNDLACQTVSGIDFRVEIADCGGERENMFERNHIEPDGIAAVQRRLQPRVELDDEIAVDIAQRYIGFAAMRFHESFEVSVDRPIFIIGIDAPANPYHTPEIVVVPAEKHEQFAEFVVVAVEFAAQPLGGYRRSVVRRQFDIGAVDAVADALQHIVRRTRFRRPPDDAPSRAIPFFGFDGNVCGETRPFAVYRNPQHHRCFTVFEKCRSLDVKQQFESVFHNNN